MAYPGKDWTEDQRRDQRSEPRLDPLPERRPGYGQERSRSEPPREERELGTARELESRVGAARGRFYGEGRGEERPSDGAVADREALYFFPDEAVSEARVRWILQHGSSQERAWVFSHLLRYAQWSDIWRYVSRDEAREMLPLVELSDRLRAAWSRMLQVEAPVA